MSLSSIPIEISILWPCAVMVGTRLRVLLTPPLAVLLYNRSRTFEQCGVENFKGPQIRDEINSPRKPTAMKIQHAPPKLRELNYQYRSVTSTKNGILKTYTRIHTTKLQTQINVYPISNLQDNSHPLTSTPFMCNDMYLSSTSNSISLEHSVPFHGSAKTAVSEHFSPLGNVFTHAHQMIISYQQPTSEAPQSIFEASAENGLNKHHKCTASKRTKRV
jgi:hypothetical protein